MKNLTANHFCPWSVLYADGEEKNVEFADHISDRLEGKP